MKNKRGLSGIVTTLMIILLVIVAIAVVWVVVRNLIIEGTDQISSDAIEVSLDLKKVQISGSEILVTVHRKVGGGEITQLTFHDANDIVDSW